MPEQQRWLFLMQIVLKTCLALAGHFGSNTASPPECGSRVTGRAGHGSRYLPMSAGRAGLGQEKVTRFQPWPWPILCNIFHNSMSWPITFRIALHWFNVPTSRPWSADLDPTSNIGIDFWLFSPKFRPFYIIYCSKPTQCTATDKICFETHLETN